ncbi:MAG: SDR family NAD(P)-dependent oxidoreductase [Pseudomonadota bacterium]
MSINRKTAVITGAASGMGEALSHLCAERGYDLALFDINGEELDGVARVCRTKGAKVITRTFDVADEAAAKQAAEQVSQEFRSVTLLFNNAGVALGGMFHHYETEDYRWLIEINFFGVVHMTRAFLPLVKKAEPRGQIINTSSIFGIIAPIGQTAYSAAKFAVRGFSEALRHELEGTSVGVTVVYPGGVATNISKRARMSKALPEDFVEEQQKEFAKKLVMPASRAAQLILNAAERGDPRLIVGNDARFAAAIQRFFPTSYWRVFKLVAGDRVPEVPDF